MAKVTKSQVSSADNKTLRSIAAGFKIKFVGKKIEDLRSECLAVAADDKPAKVSKKAAEKAPARKKERVAVSSDDIVKISAYATKKAKVITLREAGYSINAIAEAVDLHPTNVSRYIRDAGMSTSTAVVPQERKDRIKAKIAANKAAKEAAQPKAIAIEETAEPAAEEAKAEDAKVEEENKA